jgi:hypothetical protein
MRALLQYLQQNVQDNIVLMHIRGYIERFTRLGVRWPELRVLWNSIMKELKDQELDESTNEEKPDWYAGFADYLGDTNITAAVYTAKAAGVNVNNSPLLAEHLNDWKWYLLRYFERCLGLSFQGFEEIAKEIKLLKSIGVDWPELDTYWDDNKDRVMRQLLQQVTSYDEDAGFYTWQEINALRQMGVKWPELDIVMKSAMHLMSNKKDDIQEASSTGLQAALSKFDAQFKINMPVSEFSDFMWDFESNNGYPPELITKIVQARIGAIADWFDEMGSQAGMEDIWNYMTLMHEEEVLDNDMVIDSLCKVLATRKEDTIRLFLSKIKNTSFDLKDYVDILGGVLKWPEMEVIKRSLNVGRTNPNITESSNLFPRKVQNVLNRTLRYIMEGGSYYLYTFERELLAAGASSAMMSDIFIMNREVILHSIEKDLSSGKVHDALNAIDIVNAHVFTLWPEITRSVSSNIGRIKEYINGNIGGRGWGIGFTNAVNTYELLVKSKIDPALVKELKSYMRDIMLQTVKNLIKDYGFNKQVLDGLESIEKLGFRVDLGAGKMKDKLMADFAAVLAKEGLANEGPRFVKLVIKFGSESVNQEMKKVIEDNKVSIIRNMLSYIKMNATYAVYPILTMLQHLGFKWDELRVIDKSIKSGLLGDR